jgi:hypothetical protein
MLLEDDVVGAVAAYLTGQRWVIRQALRSSERGDDIIAERAGDRLLVEAKGETSAQSASARYGKPFSASQVGSHVGRAVLRALRFVSDGDRAGVAFPDERLHRHEVAKIQQALRLLDVVVFWVASDLTVTVDATTGHLDDYA